MTKILDETFKKKIYKSQILYTLHANKSISQIDICKRLNMPTTTVSSIVNNAIKSGLVKKLGKESGKRKVPGIRPVLLGLDDEKSAVLGLSFRENYFYSGLVNFHGGISNAKVCKLDNFKWEELPDMIQQEVDEAKKTGKNILGTGLAVGGYFTGNNKSLYPESKYFDVPTGIPLIADDYPNASAKLELLFGQAKEKDSFALLNLGDSGFRISCYSNGDIVRGTHGLAGEIYITNDFEQEPYRTPAHKYQHHKIRCYEKSSTSEIEEHSYYLANMVLQIMIFYDPRQIIISNIPEEIWPKVSNIINEVISKHLDFSRYNLNYEIVRATQMQDREILEGAAIILEDILMRPRINLQESAINL